MRVENADARFFRQLPFVHFRLVEKHLDCSAALYFKPTPHPSMPMTTVKPTRYALILAGGSGQREPPDGAPLARTGRSHGGRRFRPRVNSTPLRHLGFAAILEPMAFEKVTTALVAKWGHQSTPRLEMNEGQICHIRHPKWTVGSGPFPPLVGREWTAAFDGPIPVRE